MRTNKHTFRIVALSSIFALGVGLVVNINKTPKEVDAYTGTSPTTTINLNDCTEQEIRGYYSDLDSLSTSERQGTNLLKHLKIILKNEQKYLNYDSGSSIWELYEITDRDWEKSPASSISHGTYNSSTNTITNYTYGSNGDNPYIHALYVNRDVNNQTRAWGDHTQTNWGINREHIWAKSHGFQDKGAGGARGDPMHLWAGNGYANNLHSNNFFAFVDKTQSYTDCGSYRSYLSGNLSGNSKNAGGTATVFEPQDCDKGDIARSIFYMVARYNYYSGSDSDGINTNNPNLVLANSLSENSTTGTSTTSRAYAMGLLSDLLAWNKLDPVDEYEIHRNNLLYRNFTNNRNPFIDFPSWADAIWGTADLDGTHYNSSITTYATPASDQISSSSVTPVFGISNAQLNLEVGETATISSRNAESNITWTIANGAIASLNKTTTANNENVTVTALSAGTTTITATSGGNSATCQITVTDSGSSTGECVKVASYNFSSGNNSTSEYTNTNALLQRFTNSAVSGTGLSDIVTGISDVEKVYAGWTDYLSYGLKLGTSKANGGFTTTLSRQVSKVVVKVAGWEATDSIGVGDADPQTPGVAYGSANSIKTLTFEITPTSSVEFDFYKRGFIQSIDFYAEETVSDNPRNHLNNATPVSYLAANETPNALSSTMDYMIFSLEGLSNGVQYSDPFEIAEGVTITFSGGAHDGKYYNTGRGIRTYGSGSITVECDEGITQIIYTWDDSSSDYVPDDDYSNVGTYDTSTYTWTGSATSVTLTRPSGTGHWRLKAVEVTHNYQSMSVNNVKMRFGASIPVDDWYDIEESWDVDYYGVMFLKYDTLHNTYGYSSIAEAYEHGIRPRADVCTDDGEMPLPVNGNLVFTARINITSEDNYDVVYVAAPYLVIDGTHYFLDEMAYSVRSMAEAYLESGGSTLSDDALQILAGIQGD